MSAPRIGDLDKTVVEQLTIALLKDIRSHYLRRPASRDRVYEVLKALAIATAATLHECVPGVTRDWFDAALDDKLSDLARARRW